jgi:hypothetical protein
MDDPLREIDDIVVRDAIDIFQSYIESTIENLLDRDRSRGSLYVIVEQGAGSNERTRRFPGDEPH